MLTTRVPIRGGQANGNHLNLAVNGGVSEQLEKQVGHLTEDSVRQVATELFSDGSGVPAVPPPQSPLVEEASIELCMLCLHVSQYVQRVEGKLDGYNAVGYLVAYPLGRELLGWQEALKVGTSARGFAQRARERIEKKKKSISARKSKLRAKLDAGKLDAASFDAQAQALDDEFEAARAVIRQERVEVDGLPAANTTVVERRAPAAPPRTEPPHERMGAFTADMCPRARAMLDMATSQEAAAAIVAAFCVFALSRGGRDPHFNEKLDIAQVRYRHALRRLQQEYPGEFCGFSQESAREMVDWAIRIESCGQQIPAARAAARKVRFDLEAAAAACRASREREQGVVV